MFIRSEETSFLCNSYSSFFTVTGNHYNLHPGRLDFLDSSSRFWANIVADTEYT